MNKRGQAALEFLMTYGWAILVVLIAIGALAYLVDFQSLVGDRCQLTPPLYCESYKAEVAIVTMQIKNALPNSLTIESIAFNDVGASGCIDSAFTTNTIAAGGSTTFAIDCAGVASGDKVKSKITITYNETGGLPGIVKSGQIIVAVA